MNKTKPERRARKRWKRVMKWSAGVIFLGLVLVTFIAYWMSTNDCYRSSAAPNNPIKAIVHCEYGSPDVLKLEDIEKPVPNDNQLLVKVRAASVNPLDLTIRGPWLIRPVLGLRKPKDTRLGVDYAGIVEAVGKDVTNFKPGDEVFGGKNGALAEYICVLAHRAGGFGPGGRDHRIAGSSRQRKDSVRRKSFDQRRFGRRGHLRRANREIIWCGSDRRMQHAKSGHGPITWRRPRHRLHQRGFHQRRAAV